MLFSWSRSGAFLLFRRSLYLEIYQKKKSRNCWQNPDVNYRMGNEVSPIAVNEGTRWTNLLLTHLSELIQLLPQLHHLHPEHPPAFWQCVVIRVLLQSFKFDSMKSYLKKDSDQFRLLLLKKTWRSRQGVTSLKHMWHTILTIGYFFFSIPISL